MEKKIEMTDPQEEDVPIEFIQELTKLIQWFTQKREFVPQIETILSIGLSKPYQHKTTLLSTALALDKFIGIEGCAAALLMSIASPKVLDYQSVRDIVTSDFVKWIKEDLEPKFSDSVRERLTRDNTPEMIHRIDAGHNEKGVVLSLEKRDGKKFEVIINYEFFPEFISPLLKHFSEGDGVKKISPEKMREIQSGLDTLIKKAEEK